MRKTFTIISALLLCWVFPAIAAPDDGSGAGTGEPEIKEPPAVVGFEDPGTNPDYVPKTESEGSTWTFDPSKVELTTGTTQEGTNFQGARILKGQEDVIVQGAVAPGLHDDTASSRYMYWEGSTLFFGVKSPDNGNSVDAIVEFFWFESSIPRGSDFYVAQVKVKSSPDVWNKYILAKEPNFIDDYILFWNDVQPAQLLNVRMEPNGAHGSLRWDFCVPFETYKYSPAKTMQISQSYGAGYSVSAAANVQGKAKADFKEGGVVADVTGDANIQSKGYVNNDFKVQSQYTVTLFNWQMLVQSGGEEIGYKLVVLPNDVQNDYSDSGYYEYFIVMQATRGTPVHIKEIEIGGQFRKEVPLWFDSYEDLSAKTTDIWITPPRGVCLPGDTPPPGVCKSKGVCGLAEPHCVDNVWHCPVVNVQEAEETLCDGLDNDCDGQVDENITRACSTACGVGVETCAGGKFVGCDAPQPKQEICGDGIDNDCDGKIDSGCEVDPPVGTGTGTTDPPAGTGTGTTEPPKTTPDPTSPSDDGTGNGKPVASSSGSAGPKSPTAPPLAGDSGACSAGGTSGGPGGPVALLAALLLAAALRRRARPARR